MALSIAGGVAAANGSVRTASLHRYLTFSKGRVHTSVWIAHLNGSGARRLGGGDASMISPDGRLVAVASSGSSGPALRIYRVAGGKASNFYNVSTAYAYPLAWSADSRYLAVTLDNRLEVIDTTTMTSAQIAAGYLYGASFAPRGTTPGTADELVYGHARNDKPKTQVNLWESAPDGTAKRQITTNGRSLNPLWSRRGILFDRERLRGGYAYPELQIWLRQGSRNRQLTHRRTPKLQSGLVPIGVSSAGNRVLAQLEGEDTSYAWRIQIKPLRVDAVKVKGDLVQGVAISRNGRRLLVDEGAIEGPASRGTVESVGFFGGHLRKLARGAAPSWNQ